jgi:REP element-mobilizing transposase RayT
MDNKSIAHTRWNCTYHIVFIPKYRRESFFYQNAGVIIQIRDNSLMVAAPQAAINEG